jgi:hypothetical protein
MISDAGDDIVTRCRDVTWSLWKGSLMRGADRRAVKIAQLIGDLEMERRQDQIKESQTFM